MNFAFTSVKGDRHHNVILRLYTSWHKDGSEYYEVTMSPKDARQLAIELLNQGETAGYLISRSRNEPLE